DEHRRVRDRALFDLAIDSKLRGCDIVKIRICDLVVGGSIRDRATVVQQKTGKPVQFELMNNARTSLSAWLERRRGRTGDYLFPPAGSTTPAISACANMHVWSTNGSLRSV